MCVTSSLALLSRWWASLLFLPTPPVSAMPGSWGLSGLRGWRSHKTEGTWIFESPCGGEPPAHTGLLPKWKATSTMLLMKFRVLIVTAERIKLTSAQRQCILHLYTTSGLGLAGVVARPHCRRGSGLQLHAPGGALSPEDSTASQCSSGRCILFTLHDSVQMLLFLWSFLWSPQTG